MPRSLDQLLWRHALQVAYVLEVILVLGGFLSGHSDATKLGIVLLVLTALLHIAVWLIQDWFTGKVTAAFVVKSGAGLLVAGLALFGAYRVWTEYPAIPQFVCGAAGFDCAASSAGTR